MISNELISTSYFKHCKRRCKERYNVELTESMYRCIRKKIQTGQANLLDSKAKLVWSPRLKRSVRFQKYPRAKYGVSYNDKRFIVLYDKQVNLVITFLPK